MRKVTRQAANALMAGKNFTSGNTVVKDGTMYLHRNAIARIDGDFAVLSTCGWNTSTTRERLNGIPNVVVIQRRGCLYLNDVPWDGSTIRVYIHG